MSGRPAAAWWHIARRDLRAACTAPLLWLLLAAWLAVVHAVFALTLWSAHGAGGSLTPLYIEALWWGALSLTLFAPAVTMNAWAGERAQGSWQLLMTLPLTPLDLVVGKFLAGWGLLLLLIAATTGMPAVLAVVSEVAWPHAAAAYLGLVLLAGCLAALGTWIGLLVEGPVAAYIVTFGIVACLWLAGAGGAEGPLGPVAAAVGLGERIGGFVSGRIALADAAWMVAATGFALALACGALATARQGGGQPWWRRLGLAGAAPAAIAGLLLVAAIAAQRSGVEADLSADRRFSLAPALERSLRAATAPIGLVGIWPDAVDAELSGIADGAERMAAAAPGGTWRRLDPERHRPLVADFESRHGAAGAPALWVVRGERAQRIALTRASRLTLQREVAGALLALADPAPPTVRLLQGHGELRPGGGGDDGCDALAGVLRGAGLAVATSDDAAPPPPPTDVLAVLGPTAPLGAAGLARLDTHLRDGGGVLLLADDRAPRDLALWLRTRGVLLSGAVPADIAERGAAALLGTAGQLLPPRHLVSLSHHVAIAGHELPHHNLLLRDDLINGRHPASAAVAAGGLQLLSPFSAPGDLLPGELAERLGARPWRGETLLASARGDAWERARGEPLRVPAGLDQADARGLAWALEYAPAADAASAGRGGRLVLWASRQAGSDGVVGQASVANGLLLANAARWLAHRDAPPDVPEAETRAFQVTIGGGALEILLAIIAIVVPVLCIGGAIIAWIEQKR